MRYDRQRIEIRAPEDPGIAGGAVGVLGETVIPIVGPAEIRLEVRSGADPFLHILRQYQRRLADSRRDGAGFPKQTQRDRTRCLTEACRAQQAAGTGDALS